MRTNHCIADRLSICSLTSGADLVLIQQKRSNSNPSDNSSDLLSLSVPSDSNHSGEQMDDISEYSCPSDNDDEGTYFSTDDNDEIYLEKHLNRMKLNQYVSLEETKSQRSKRSNKKLHAQRQIKSKHAKTIKYKSHNKHLYIHHRLAKRVHLDPVSSNYKPSDTIPKPLYTFEQLRTLIYHCRQPYRISRQRNYLYESELFDEQPQIYSTHLYRDYTLNELNIPDEPSYDDTMVNFLLDMQNRDLSPEDYEMLLRLDERIERKTVNTNILSTLPTIDVDDQHINDLCSICIENYHLGQQLKLLPCSHMFHKECIEKYFQEFSNRCPLDNLPLI